jgi:hypothetical protein
VTAPIARDWLQILVSILVTTSELGYKPEDSQKLVNSFWGEYQKQLTAFVNGTQDKQLPLLQDKQNRATQMVFESAKRKQNGFLRQFSEEKLFSLQNPLLKPISVADKQLITDAIEQLGESDERGASYFKVTDVARLPVMITDIGLDRFIVMTEGPSRAIDDNQLLEVRELKSPTEIKTPITEARAQELVDLYKTYLPAENDLFKTMTLDSQVFWVGDYSRAHLLLSLTDLRADLNLKPYLDHYAIALARFHAQADPVVLRQVLQAPLFKGQDLTSLASRYAATLQKEDFVAFRNKLRPDTAWNDYRTDEATRWY